MALSNYKGFFHFYEWDQYEISIECFLLTKHLKTAYLIVDYLLISIVMILEIIFNEVFPPYFLKLFIKNLWKKIIESLDLVDD